MLPKIAIETTQEAGAQRCVGRQLPFVEPRISGVVKRVFVRTAAPLSFSVVEPPSLTPETFQMFCN